ncbi:MAG: histidinol-phosphate transaminase [Firmicutes bacterium]|nr:histidinol-phosphate transaminase [Bacillota bacterium]
MNKYIPKKIAELEEYSPDTTPRDVRLDANESAYGLSEEMRKCAEEAASALLSNRYPDPYASRLRAAFARAYRADPSCVVAGNGSDELISLLFTAFTEKGDKVVVTSPDFSMYGFYAELAGAEVVEYRKNEANEIDFRELAEIVKSVCPKLVILSNPCNPTGRAYSRDEIAEFVNRCGCLAVIDEAYAEFCGCECSVMDMIPDSENLIVLKTLSKAFGLAALRVGFAVAAPEIASALNKVKSPYNLNSFSQVLGTAALERADGTFASAAETGAAAKRLKNSLESLLCGMTVFDTSANFVFIDAKSEKKAAYIKKELADASIAIRMMNKRFLRITCGSKDENERLLCVLGKIIMSKEFSQDE